MSSNRNNIPTASTKEAIKSRMLKSAAAFWGYTDTDIDSFDPVVKLLIEACATEVNKVSNEISSSQTRGLNRLAKLLTPDSYTGPRPSHAIVHARSYEPEVIIKPNLQMYYQKKIPSKVNGTEDSNIDIFFSPTSQVKLFDVGVKYIATGENLFSISNSNSKEYFLKTKYGARFNPHTVWIGVEIKDEIKNLDGLSFFIDWKNQTEKSELYKDIQHTKWYLDNDLVQTTNEFIGVESGSQSIMEEFDTIRMLEQEAMSTYSNRFITFNNQESKWKDLASKKCNYPDEFKRILVEEELYQLSDPLIWFKITFPPICSEELLEDIFISTNCFPVVNRHINEIRYQLQNFINIVPLPTKEHFLGVRTVSGTDGVLYTNLLFDQAESSDNEEQKLGTYSLREGGVERFDDRSASEYLLYLLELLRDESAAFAAMGQDFNASMVKDLNQRISLIDVKTKQGYGGATNLPAYVMIKPRNAGETIFVEYWSTNGQMSNNLRIGGVLNQYEGADLQSSSIVFMTNTIGGRDRLQGNEVLQAYKSALMTRGRIVTMQDIKSTCIFELGERASKIEVVKGVDIGSHPGEGLLRTIDVIIYPSNYQSYSIEDWDVIKQDLKVKLSSRSVAFNNYRVFLKQ